MFMMFECIVENKHTILTNFKCREAHRLNLQFKKDAVYANILDEYLNYEQVTVSSDWVSSVYIFKLKDDTYTMSSSHNIGLRNLKDAYYIVEII